jgi:hypothetical protein
VSAHLGYVVNKVALERVLLVRRFVLPSISPNSPHSSSSGGGTIDHSVAAIIVDSVPL